MIPRNFSGFLWTKFRTIHPSIRPSVRPSVRPSTSVRATLGSIDGDTWQSQGMTWEVTQKITRECCFFEEQKPFGLGRVFWASGFLSANGLMVNDVVLGAFGGLDSSDPPVKGILKGPPIRGTQTTGTAPNHGDPNHWLIFLRQSIKGGKVISPLAIGEYFSFSPWKLWGHDPIWRSHIFQMGLVETQPPTSLPSKDCLQDLLYAPALEVPWSMSPFFQLGAGCVEGTEETFFHSNYWDVGVHLRKLRNVPVKRDDFRTVRSKVQRFWRSWHKVATMR